MIGKPPNLKLYVDSVIRQSPNRTTWCHSHDDIWDNIEPYKENSYVGHMTLNEIFLFCSRKGIKSKPFNKWWGRKTLSRHVNSFFKNESHVDFDNLPTHNDNGRYMKLSSVVEILYDLPIRNQISIIQTDKVLEVHPGGTRLALKDFYLDPVPVFLYSYEPIDFLEKITRDNIEILNPESAVHVYSQEELSQDVITVEPPTERYGIQEFANYGGTKYVKTDNEITVDSKLIFLKKEGEWIINPNFNGCT